MRDLDDGNIFSDKLFAVGCFLSLFHNEVCRAALSGILLDHLKFSLLGIRHRSGTGIIGVVRSEFVNKFFQQSIVFIPPYISIQFKTVKQIITVIGYLSLLLRDITRGIVYYEISVRFEKSLRKDMLIRINHILCILLYLPQFSFYLY